MSNELWSIWIAGPDDLVAMPSKAVAEAVARNFNGVWDRYGAERDLKVHAVAHVEPWMHGKAAHTKDLREHFHEYADLKLDEEAPPSAEPAQPVEAAGALAATTFICHLIDNHEGEKVTEESLQSWLAEALAHPRSTVTPELRDSDLHASAPDQHHEIARAVWEQMNRRSAPGVIMAMAYTAVLHALAKTAPTVDQAGEVVGYFCNDTGDFLSVRRYAWHTESVRPLPGYVPVGPMPRPVGVPDGWKLVPVEPTDAMVTAMAACSKRTDVGCHSYAASSILIYKAMLAAAPAPEVT